MSTKVMRKAIRDWRKLGGEFQWKQLGGFITLSGRVETAEEVRARQERWDRENREAWRLFFDGVMQ